MNYDLFITAVEKLRKMVTENEILTSEEKESIILEITKVSELVKSDGNDEINDSGISNSMRDVVSLIGSTDELWGSKIHNLATALYCVPRLCIYGEVTYGEVNDIEALDSDWVDLISHIYGETLYYDVYSCIVDVNRLSNSCGDGYETEELFNQLGL